MSEPTRGKREDGGGRVATRNRDQVGVLQLGLVELGKPEDGAGKQAWSRMLLAIPDRVLLGILKPKVGAHVDHPRAGGEPPGGFGRADTVRQAAENHVDAFWIRVRLEFSAEIQQREDVRVRLTRVRPGGQLGELHVWMAGQQVDESHARIAVGARDSGLDRLAHERMSIQETA